MGVKRIFDVAVSASALLTTLPLLLVISIVIAVKLGLPVFYIRPRPGLNGRLFNMVKFRTMANTVDASGELLPDEARMTHLGQLLRSTSLDELPELWNVLKGDMSLVGPRPLLPHYLDRYTMRQARRHEVRPGITGWAQVNGRNALSWDEKFELDVWYVDNQTLWLDLRILLMTILQVVRRQGISSEGHATAAEFMGHRAREEER